MKKQIIKLMTTLMITMMTVIGLNINDSSILENKVFAEVTVIGTDTSTTSNTYSTTGQTIDADQFFEKITDVVFPLAKKFGRFFIFVAVLAIGFDLIKDRKNKDKQKESLNSLIYLAVGAMIISGALLFSNFIWGTGSSISEAPQQTTNMYM